MTFLALLRYGVTWASARSGRAQSLLEVLPTIRLQRGEWQAPAMWRKRITEEVLDALRSQGAKADHGAAAVVICMDGCRSVLANAGRPPGEGRVR